MQCLICKKQYSALGVHIRHKHKMDPDDYRDQFGMLRTTPLVDPWLSKVFSESSLQQLNDPERAEQMHLCCIENAKAQTGKAGPGMSDAGKELLAGRNRARNVAYLEGKADAVIGILRQQPTICDVKKATGMGANAVKSIIATDLSCYSKDDALNLRLQRATATQHAKRADRVAAYRKVTGSAKSAAEACRMAGITIKTYRNWVAAGVIEKQKRIRS